MATHEYMTQVTEAMSKTNCLKNILAPYLETLKDIATKSGETHLWDRALPSCTFSSQSVWDIFHWTKKYIFFLRGHPWGLPSHAIHFWKALIEPSVTPHLTCNAATYHFPDIHGRSKSGILGPLEGTPNGETVCPRPISTIMQNLTPISVTIAEISVIGCTETKKELQQT